MKTTYRLVDGQWQPVRSTKKPHFRLKNGTPYLVRPVTPGKETTEHDAQLLIKAHYQHIKCFADALRLPRQSVYIALSPYHQHDGGYVRRARLALGLKSQPSEQAMRQSWLKAHRRNLWAAQA